MTNEIKKPIAEENLGLVHYAHNSEVVAFELWHLYRRMYRTLKAVKAFDTQRGVKFSTYAIPVILGEVKRLFRDGGTVKVSRTLKELSLRLQRCRDEFIKPKAENYHKNLQATIRRSRCCRKHLRKSAAYFAYIMAMTKNQIDFTNRISWST